MLNFLRQQIAQWRLKRSPLFQALQDHVDEYMNGDVATSTFSPENKQKLVDELYGRVDSVLGSSDPRMTCRELLAGYVVSYTHLRVHCLKADEKAEQPYRDNPYISGQLWKHIGRTSEHHEDLAQFKWEVPSLTDDELIGMGNTRCAVFLFFLNGFNILRRYLGDMSQEKDWLRPFVEALLVFEEHHLREKLGLPTLVPDLLDGVRYSTFLEDVLSGEPNPFFTWARRYPDTYLAGQGAALT